MEKYSTSTRLIKNTKGFLSIEYYSFFHKLLHKKGVFYGWGRKRTGLCDNAIVIRIRDAVDPKSGLEMSILSPESRNRLIKNTKGFLSIEYYLFFHKFLHKKGVFYGWGRKRTGLYDNAIVIGIRDAVDLKSGLKMSILSPESR